MRVDELRCTLLPLLAELGLDLFDVEVSTGTINVTVSRPGGVDLETLAEANRRVSSALDLNAAFEGRYTLEVSSPGLERKLRTPEHFAGAVGETLSVRIRGEIPRRVRGTLLAVDATGIVVSGPEAPEGSVRIEFDALERARTVFEWGSERPASPSRAHKARRSPAAPPDAPRERVET